ncbi:hypothetical protein ACFX13_034679 [Malus domestica]
MAGCYNTSNNDGAASDDDDDESDSSELGEGVEESDSSEDEDLQPDDLQPLFHRKRPESDSSVPDATARAEKFAQRYTEILEDLKKDPESHGGPPDCILLYRLREQVLRKLGFQDIFKKVKDEENAKAISPFENVVDLNDAIEDEVKRVENLVRGIFAGNIFDLGSAQLAEIFSKDGMSFLASCQNLVPRHWVIDDMDAFKLKWTKKSWKKASYISKL